MEPEDDIQQTPDETPAPPKKKKGRKKKAAAKADAPAETPTTPAPPTAAELLAMADQLTGDERRKLALFGAVLPEGLQEDSVTGRPTWGYWCSHCNGIAMHFPGTKWAGGSDRPLAGTPIDSVAWVQIRGQKSGNPEVIESPNRSNPLCPCCGAGVRLGPGRTLHPDHLTVVSEHEQSIDKHFSLQHKLAVKRELDQKNADIGDAAQNDEIPAEKALSASQRMTPEQREQVEHAAAQIDFGDGL